MKKKFQSFDLFCNECVYTRNISNLLKIGTKLKKTGKRNVCMTCFGSTAGVSTTPRFLINGKVVYVPRPYKVFKPTTKERALFDKNDLLRNLVKDIEKICICCLMNLKDEWSKEALVCLQKSPHITPSCCRIYETGFNFMSINGDMKDSQEGIKLHLDEDDYFNFVLHLGNSVQGGGTIYGVSKNNQKNDIQFHVPFEHGKFQISRFSHVYHGTNGWIGNRCSINLAVKKKIYNFFDVFGKDIYIENIVKKEYRMENKVILL